ncbi:transposase [Micromonospora sp. NPDC048830]|uniref:transposase n=1 Tax=Micromonospora sp. NPDC048830 TaxID=3364257 RepID=UPI00371B011B
MWAVLAPLMPVRDLRKGGRPRKYGDRLILDSIFYVLRSGCLAGCGAEAVTGQDSADGAEADAVAQSEHLALDSFVVPAGVVPGHSADELADLVADGWSAAAVGVGPAALDQPAVPGQQSRRGHDPVDADRGAGGGPARTGSPGLARTVVVGCGPDGAAPRPVAQGQQFREHRAVAASREEQSVEQADRDQIDQLEDHDHEGALFP